MENCVTCKFWLKLDEPNSSICRESPPSVMIQEINQQGQAIRWQSVFPPMNEDGWCGHYKKKTIKQNV